MRFLNSELWDTPSWLLNPDLISNIKGSGNLSRISGIQSTALSRFLSAGLLNRMLSSEYTLVGSGLTPDQLLKTLYADIFTNRKSPDVLGRNLQKAFIEDINNLIEDKALSPEIKGLALALKKEINKWSSKLAKSGEDLLKVHYAYCQIITK